MKFIDSDDYSNFEYESREEDQLMKKFNDYVDLEKRIKKMKFLEISDESEPGKFGKRFIISAMAQGAIVVGLTIALFLNQILVFNGDIENMFKFAFTDNSGIFFFGFILQIGLTAGLTITGLFYNHIEKNQNKRFTGFNNILSWIHLGGTNLFGSIITISLIFTGIATSVLYQSEANFWVESVPALVYVSVICLVIIFGIGIIRTSLSFIKGNED